jgi:hypothetical protein
MDWKGQGKVAVFLTALDCRGGKHGTYGKMQTNVAALDGGRREVAGSIPDEVIRFFPIYLTIPASLWFTTPLKKLAPRIFLDVKLGRRVRWTLSPSRNLLLLSGHFKELGQGALLKKFMHCHNIQPPYFNLTPPVPHLWQKKPFFNFWRPLTSLNRLSLASNAIISKIV